MRKPSIYLAPVTTTSTDDDDDRVGLKYLFFKKIGPMPGPYGYVNESNYAVTKGVIPLMKPYGFAGHKKFWAFMRKFSTVFLVCEPEARPIWFCDDLADLLRKTHTVVDLSFYFSKVDEMVDYGDWRCEDIGESCLSIG